ncbi:hypothetical protein IOD13_18520 [Brevibacterium casei]|nr:hypothetical protein [Brevibacterium casei]
MYREIRIHRLHAVLWVNAPEAVDAQPSTATITPTGAWISSPPAPGSSSPVPTPRRGPCPRPGRRSRACASIRGVAAVARDIGGGAGGSSHPARRGGPT